MEVNQLHEFLSTVYTEVTGKEGIVQENLSNIVDVGKEVLSVDYRESYVNSMLNLIGRWVFVDRPYEGQAPNIIREAWEWGSIMSKSRTKDPEPTVNPTWDLKPGESVDQYVFTPPEVQTTLYNTMDTWEIDCSFVNRQLKQSMDSAAMLDRFIGMIRTNINNTQVSNIDELTMRCYNNLIGHRLSRKVAIIDVLESYNSIHYDAPITADEAPYNPEFLRHLAFLILIYKNRMRKKIANFADLSGGYTTFTPPEYAHLVLLDVFSEALKIYLESDTYHDDLLKIGAYDMISNWQGTGKGSDFRFADISQINIQVSGLSTGAEVNRYGIIGILHDRDALGIINEDRRVEVAYNAKGEYWNNFFKIDTRLFNDVGENAIIFVMGNGIDVYTAPLAPGEEIFGYKASQLQSNLRVDANNKISGDLYYISTGALIPNWGAGNFMALKFLNIPDNATSCKVGMDPSQSSGLVEIIDDPDRAGTFKVTDPTTQKFVIETTIDGLVNRQVYDLSGLTLMPEPQELTEEQPEEQTEKKTTSKK